MIRTLAFAFAALILLEACGDNSDSAAERKNGYTPVMKDRGDSLFHEVMKGHDTGMARIGKLGRSIGIVKKSLDSLAKVKNPDAAVKSSLQSLDEELNQADYSMQTWMTEFRADTLQDDKDKRAEYLEKELVKVNKMKERIISSLARFDSVYSK